MFAVMALGWKASEPWQTILLLPATDSVIAIKNKRDSNDLRHARKSMIKCSMAKDVDGVWKIDQLKPELISICLTYNNHFDGEEVLPLCAASSSAQEDDSSSEEIDRACAEFELIHCAFN